MGKENGITLLHNLMDVYESACQPICKEMGVTHTAFCILMFLANNPEYYTAKDVSKFRAIKPNIVSFNVEKLVNEGYLERQPIPGNRRSIKLVCTEKAAPVITQGRKTIADFISSLTSGMSEDDMVRFSKYLDLIEENITAMKENMKRGNTADV